MSNQPDTLGSEPEAITMKPMETTGRHAATDTRTIGLEVQGADVVTVLRGNDSAETLDAASEWRQQVGARPVLILARMLASLAAWADQHYAEPLMPGPDVLTALRTLA